MLRRGEGISGYDRRILTGPVGHADIEMTAEVSEAAAYPLRRCKTIHLVRHGQGFHNVAGESDFKAYLSPDYFDASLTAKGWQQVTALRNHVRSVGIADSLQLVVVSPLTRTMQTAVGIFGGEDIVNGADAGPALMVDGSLYDRPKPKSASRDWLYLSTQVEEDEDVLWSPTERETKEQLFGRTKKFVEWILKRKETDIAVVSHSGFIFQFMTAVLLKRKETDIAVVSHSSFLRHLMATFGDGCSAQVKSELHNYFANCEMRSIVLVDRRAEEEFKGATTDFPGGIPAGSDAPSDTCEDN
ncbi:hypothetical protein AXG93_4280s1270 [Marchantia polymorpha subsp. ruderalis]|uniref:Phosphoglycerate mutase-like protein n=1 Tax=Marchantia polymorpha subsp. ruderalis TaxID=1480154 RepID=A0A176WPA2_MARPO|nr:hypothetical protein AXG93_4280s1270 [Marchantia polymorpha subsp. ruderalis]